jgi:hypothetical protein
MACTRREKRMEMDVWGTCEIERRRPRFGVGFGTGQYVPRTGSREAEWTAVGT